MATKRQKQGGKIFRRMGAALAPFAAMEVLNKSKKNIVKAADVKCAREALDAFRAYMKK